MWEKGLGGRDTGVGVRGVLGKRRLCDCWGEERGKEEEEVVGCCQAVEGSDTHPKEFGLYSAANGGPWDGF